MGKHINSSNGKDIDPIICTSHFKVKCSRSNKQGKEFSLCLSQSLLKDKSFLLWLRLKQTARAHLLDACYPAGGISEEIGTCLVAVGL